MRIAACIALLLFSCGDAASVTNVKAEGHHHHHHGKKHHHKHKHEAMEPSSSSSNAKEPSETREQQTKALTQHSAAKVEGQLDLNGPLPADFGERFAQAVAEATSSSASDVEVVSVVPMTNSDGKPNGIVLMTFKASESVVNAVHDQAADPESKLATGNLHHFLVADDAPSTPEHITVNAIVNSIESGSGRQVSALVPDTQSGLDVDTAMPYGDLEAFGREDTAQELTEHSVSSSDEMIDQLERAEIAEEKRSVFRALTRLRGAAISSFDGIARSQTGNIDEYNQNHKWRTTHPLHHLASEESDVAKWAFPERAD